MSLNRFQKIALGIAGVTAAGIGTFILAAPHAFYASYGITLGNDANLLSELRAPAAGLLGLGIIMLVGMVRSAWTQPALFAAFTVYVAFPAGRILGIVLDGMPANSVMGALIIEVAILALLLAAFGRRSKAKVSVDPHPNWAG